MHSNKNNLSEFIQTNSPDGGFLQSDIWRKFQEAAGRKTHLFSSDGFFANIIEHELPLVGKYFYIPRGPVLSVSDERISNFQFPISNQIPNSNGSIKENIREIINLAKKNNIGWIRFDPIDGKITELIHELIPEFKIKKAPHDMQPREIFTVGITKPEEQLQSEMKSKTRYNIKLAQKHGVKIYSANSQQPTANNYSEEFIRLVKITAKRDKITPHPEEYYRKMFEVIPADNLKLYFAEYSGKIIAANMVVFYGKVATYLHGASDNEHRNVMAPYLLQWQAMLDAQKVGCEKYDFGGIKKNGGGAWAGITRFKTGFSADTEPIKFPGSYDIVVSPANYILYRIIQRIKTLF